MELSSHKESFRPPLWILTLLALIATCWLIYQLKELVVLIVVGYFIAYVIDPLVSRLERRKIPRGIGVIFIFLCLAAAITLLFLTAIPTLVEEYGRLHDNFSNYLSVSQGRLQPAIEWAWSYVPERFRQGDKLSSVMEIVPSLGNIINGEAIGKVFSAVFVTLLGGYSLTLTIVNLALLPFIVFYLSVDFHYFHGSIINLLPTLRRKKALQMFGEINRYVSAFVRGQLIVCTVLFCLYAIGLWSVGVELWLLLAVIAGFGNLIPYLGFLSGIILSSIMALVTFGDLSHVFLIWGVFAVVQGLEGTFITPRIIGSSVGLSPLVIIVALFAGGQLFGLLGIFLAVPAAACIRVLAKYTLEWMRGVSRYV